MAAEELLQQVRDIARRHRNHAVAPRKLFQEGLDGRHGQRRARTVALYVAENIEVHAFAELHRLVKVAADHLLRLPDGRVEAAVGHHDSCRQHAVLDVRRERLRGMLLLYLALDELLDAPRGDDTLYSAQHHLWLRRLRQVVAVRVQQDFLEESAPLLGIERRNEEDRQRRVVAANDVTEHEAIHVAHHDVGDDGPQLDIFLLEHGNGFLDRIYGDRHIPHTFKLGAYSEANQLFIIDDQDLRRDVMYVGHMSFPS